MEENPYESPRIASEVRANRRVPFLLIPSAALAGAILGGYYLAPFCKGGIDGQSIGSGIGGLAAVALALAARQFVRF
jgi:hypothetical protein